MTVSCWTARAKIALALGVWILTVRPALAADVPAAKADAALQSGDIVVTAQKRGDQRLQDVPLSIVAIAGETLRKQGAVAYRDYLVQLPGVSYQSNGGFKDKIAIRGVADAIGSRTLSTTGIYVDEAPISEVDASLADISTYDLERVEVLRGPQGTLYGASSMGGTVRLITNKPSLTQSGGQIDATGSSLAHGGFGYSADGYVNVPLITDLLALRVTGGYRRTAGFIDNLAYNKDDANSGISDYVRAQLRYQPNPALNVLLSVQHKFDKRNGNPDEDLNRVKYDQYRLFPDHQHYNTNIYGLTVDYDLSFAHLTSATNYIDKKGVTTRDFSADVADIADAGFSVAPDSGAALFYSYPNKLFSQEVRVSSTRHGRFNWLIGGYYSRFHPHNAQTEHLTDGQLADVDFYSSLTNLKRTQLAIFGELSYEIVDGLTATAGVRASRVTTHSYNFTDGILNGETDDGPALRSNNKNVQQRYNLQYKLDENHQLYAQAAQGFRAGGPIVPSTRPACLAELATIGYSSAPTQYGPDRLWNYEIGVKNAFLARKLRVNVSGYQIDWRNVQLSESLACGDQFTANAGRARIRGAELESSLAPTPGLILTFNLGYTDSEFRDTNTKIRTVKGGSLPGVPKWNYSASLDYERPITARVSGFFHTDYGYVGGNRLSDLPGQSASRLRIEPSYDLLGARLGARFEGFEVSVFGTNILDKRGILATSFGQHNYQTVTTPRRVGVEVMKTF